MLLALALEMPGSGKQIYIKDFFRSSTEKSPSTAEASWHVGAHRSAGPEVSIAPEAVSHGRLAGRINRRSIIAGALAGSILLAASMRVSPSSASGSPMALLPGPLTPVLGNPKGTRTLAVFFDYHCSYCREMDPKLHSLVQQNADLRILFKEFPILQPDSQLAARMALAAQVRGRYFEVHDLLMRLPVVFTDAVVTDVARWLKVDPTAFREDMGNPHVDAELQKNFDDAHAIGVEGTPALVTAVTVERSARSLKELQRMIDAIKS